LIISTGIFVAGEKCYFYLAQKESYQGAIILLPDGIEPKLIRPHLLW